MQYNLHYKVSFRLVNIAIADSIHLSPTITLQSLTPSDTLAKYGKPRDLSPTVQAHIHKHTVEAVFERTATKEGYSRDMSVDRCHALERSITDAFLIAMPSNNQAPYAIQARFEPPEKSDMRVTLVTLRGVGDFIFHPSPLSDLQVRNVESTYRLLTRSQNDRILVAAIDRLILGKQRDLHHVSRMNEPNWDKVVDYVIGLETLFLTVNGKPISHELAYRFQLNGSSLLATCTSTDRRLLLDALKLLYDLRSSVVHGQLEAATRKIAEKFIRTLQIDEEGERHSVGRLDIICRRLEDWFKLLITHLDALDPEKRPYLAKGAWEDLLWQKMS